MVPVKRHKVRSNDRQRIGPAPRADSEHESERNQFFVTRKLVRPATRNCGLCYFEMQLCTNWRPVAAFDRGYPPPPYCPRVNSFYSIVYGTLISAKYSQQKTCVRILV